MFKKRKGKKKASNRKRDLDDDEGDNDNETSNLLQEARMANNINKKQKTSTTLEQEDKVSSTTTPTMQQYQPQNEPSISEKDLATSTSQLHPDEDNKKNGKAEKGADGIFRCKVRNKFHAGPIRASKFMRTTARFDYQPDICKDYKETGFCGFGDTCIYLHDRGDSMTGWQLEQQWEEQKKKERKQKELEAFADGREIEEDKSEIIADDGIPFACFICRDYFKDPVVTRCGHYFCEKCIMNHVRKSDKPTCPISKKDTHGVFNHPTKLISKKRRLLGSSATWKEFKDYQKGGSDSR